MDPPKQQVSLQRVFALAAKQHGVVSRAQLLELGMDAEAIKYRVRRGRLHSVHRGVYAVGRPQLTRRGTLLAAVLSCGPGAALSHEAAAEVLGIRRQKAGAIDVTVPRARRGRPGIRIHRAALPANERTERHGIPVTSVVRTLVDLATGLRRDELEAAVNEADRLDLIDPEHLREALDDMAGRRGAARLRGLLDRRSFTLTESALERRFLAIVRRAGLPLPLTQQQVNGFRVDFWWPKGQLVVETDGLRYHRTPAQQARDRRRDQAHVAAGLTPLRFTHAQVAYEPAEVERILRAAATRAPTARPSAPATAEPAIP
jgi:very-short-patch-repair endonuclease